MDISANLAGVKERIRTAARSCGRNAEALRI